MKLKLYYLTLAFLIIKCSGSEDDETCAEDKLSGTGAGEIIHASVIFRHGDRTPYAPYPLDPYKSYTWSEGYGQLTKTGKERMYDLGKWFRKRYHQLIAENYWSEEILVQSSDYDRTLMSAELFLAGLYPPTESELWNDDINWQPIPVHSIPMEYDNMISMHQSCSAYNTELLASNDDPLFQGLFGNNEVFFNYVGTHSGNIFSQLFVGFSLLKLMEVFDSLNVQQQHSLPLPEWAESVFPEPMTRISLKLYEYGTHTDKMKRIKSGPFLRSLRSDMNNKVRESNEQKLHVYSGHDATIVTTMKTLGIFNDIFPPYGSALMFELRKNNSDYFVTISYKNTTDQPPYVLEIPNCGSICPLKNFLNIVEPFIPKDWDTECSVGSINEGGDKWWPFNPVQTVLLAIVLAVISSSMLHFGFQRSKQNYIKQLSKPEESKTEN